ncbi:MAG: hypothetical protein DWH78_13130 [Planctomycetota bacterium]|nr:MAG: hypothetical protein DWH78_13130 [Planctomycetota bacterium]
MPLRSEGFRGFQPPFHGTGICQILPASTIQEQKTVSLAGCHKAGVYRKSRHVPNFSFTSAKARRLYCMTRELSFFECSALFQTFEALSSNSRKMPCSFMIPGDLRAVASGANL